MNALEDILRSDCSQLFFSSTSFSGDVDIAELRRGLGLHSAQQKRIQ